MVRLTKVSARRVTTTEGRQRLPDLIQQVYGEKCVIVFHRYGRDLAALVPLDMLPAEGEVALNIPKCGDCGAFFPASTADFCGRAECPHQAARQALSTHEGEG